VRRVDTSNSDMVCVEGVEVVGGLVVSVEGVTRTRWKYVQLVLRKVDWWRMWDSLSFEEASLRFRFFDFDGDVDVSWVVGSLIDVSAFASAIEFADFVPFGAVVGGFEGGIGAIVDVSEAARCEARKDVKAPELNLCGVGKVQVPRLRHDSFDGVN
jgi:hypothetical protein